MSELEPTNENIWKELENSSEDFLPKYCSELRLKILLKLYKPLKVLAFQMTLPSMEHSRIKNEIKGKYDLAEFIQSLKTITTNKLTDQETKNIAKDHSELEALTTVKEIQAWAETHNAKMSPEELEGAKRMTIAQMRLSRDEEQKNENEKHMGTFSDDFPKHSSKTISERELQKFMKSLSDPETLKKDIFELQNELDAASQSRGPGAEKAKEVLKPVNAMVNFIEEHQSLPPHAENQYNNFHKELEEIRDSLAEASE